MIYTETIDKTKEAVSRARKEGKKIGFVPTMGALHEGHIALVQGAARENDFVVVSIFVNPIQFNNQEDLKRYPRNIAGDKQMLEDMDCDLLFHPGVKEMYPEEVSVEYDFGELDKVLEGKFRPGHFKGVAVVVKRLFDIVEPDNAYFGEKDYQQLQIVRELVRKEDIPVNIRAYPTLREADGLAMSSRNKNLSEEERKIASVLYNTLSKAKSMAFRRPVDEIKEWANKQINNYQAFDVEYFEIVDGETLKSVQNLEAGNKYVFLVAAHLGKVRLIDNVIINS